MADHNRQTCLCCNTQSQQMNLARTMDIMAQKCLAMNPLQNSQMYPGLNSSFYPTLPANRDNFDNVRMVVGALDKKSNQSNSKKSKTPVPSERKDDKYWDKRKRNNESAKRSREARKLKDGQVATRATWLEEENIKIKAENAALREELACWRYYYRQPYPVHPNHKNLSLTIAPPLLF